MKFTRAIIIILLLMLPLFGCNKEVNLNATALAAQLMEQIDFPEMLEIAPERLYRFYPSISADSLSVAKVYLCAEAVLADEIAIFQVKDAAKVAEIKAALTTHYQERVNTYADYAPQEAERIKKRIFIEKDRWLIVVISDNNEQANKLIRETFK